MRIPRGYHEHIISPGAARRVEAVWSFAARQDGASLVLPDGRCDLIVRYEAARPGVPVVVVTGPATRAYAVRFCAGDLWYGVRLRPGDGAALWAGGLIRAANCVLRGTEAVAMVPGLAALAGPDLTGADVMGVVSGLAAARGADPRTRSVIERLHVTGGRACVPELAQMVGCSPRHLSRVFAGDVGLTVKTYAQLVQFHRSLRLIREGRLSVSAAAYEGGYADQAHLARAFRRFGGFAPTRIPPDIDLPALFS